MTGPGFYQWQCLLIIMPRIRVPDIYLSSWTVAITLGCRTRKKSTPTFSPSRRTSFQQNSESWWLYIAKTSTIPKNFKNELTIRGLNFGDTSPARKFGWIANTLRPSGIASGRQSSLCLSGYSSQTDPFHAQWSLRLKKKAIIMSGSWDLPITWSQYINIHIIYLQDLDTWFTNFILISSYHWF